MMITRIIGFLLVGALALVLVGQRIPAVQDFAFNRAVEKRFSGSTASLMDGDGLKVFMCGTSSPIASPKRAQSCTAIIAGDRIFLVDTGKGSIATMQRAGLPMDRLTGIYLTHYHSDHIGDIGEAQLISWVSGREGNLLIFGPSQSNHNSTQFPGEAKTQLATVVDGFREAYSFDTQYRTAHHGKAIAPPRNAQYSTIAINGDAPRLVNKAYDVNVSSFPVNHDPVSPSVGYRFEYKGRSVVVSGDTAYSPDLVEAARGADLLVHEAQANHMVEKMGVALAQAGNARMAKIMDDIQTYHTTPVEAARAVNEAGVEMLVLTHLTPPPDNPMMKKMFMRGVADVRRDGVVLAQDGMLIELPADGGIEISRH